MTVNTKEICEIDFNLYKKLPLPIKRSAYSDRMAWIMAIMSELAYEQFEDLGSIERINQLARDLAEISDEKNIAKRLKQFYESIRNPDASRKEKLEATLKIGDFYLVGEPFDNVKTDTQGFVVRKQGNIGEEFAVLCFRGTTSIQDWMTNLRFKPEPVYHPKGRGYAGEMHKGFVDAHKSVEETIDACLDEVKDLPLYITGHSLGGALAVVATWHIPCEKLAACYTFGAPRVGTYSLIDKFRTPIYRVVNGPDPVPFVPPSKLWIDILKIVLRSIASVFNLGIGKLIDNAINLQGYRHYGDMRYLTPISKADYKKSDFSKMRVEFYISGFLRMGRFLRRIFESERIDKYHDISRYRRKLLVYAAKQNGIEDQIYR